MLLSSLIFAPAVFALVVMLVPKIWVRQISLGLSTILFFASLLLLKNFHMDEATLQMVERHEWIKSFGISYFVGIDGLSLWLVILTTFLMPITILGSWNSIEDRIKGFHACMFLLQTTMIGTFLAMDAILFYTFFEASLVPMYFMIGMWGGLRRIYATLKFFIFTMVGSVFMLIAIISMMFLVQRSTGLMSASLLDFYALNLPRSSEAFLDSQLFLFFAFALAFAIKVPMFPFHTWLPDAHVEAPTPGSVILAGVMLKMGTYGLLRFAIPLFPEVAIEFAWLFLLFGVIGIIYGALVAMVQPDMKKLVAYSSVSHMGYIILGLFTLNQKSLTGSILQMINHGISTGALFLLVGMIYERTHSREISKYGGLATKMPIFAIFFVIVTMSSIAVPMTNGFVGEFLILLGSYISYPNYTYVAVIGVVLGAAYMLWMVKKVFYGPMGELVKAEGSHELQDMSWREIAVMVPLVIMIFWMGIFPIHFTKYSAKSIESIAVRNIKNYQLKIYGGK
jgi:NADH-quinone oxidoreductase subunit M